MDDIVADGIALTGKQSSNASVKLENRVAELLNDCLGALPYGIRVVPRVATWELPEWPSLKAVAVGATYALLFCALPWLVVKKPESHLFWLSVYGSLYAAWATWIARYTSATTLDLIRSRIIPDLSSATADRIDADLARYFSPARLAVWSSLAAAILTVAAAFAISRDVHDAPLQVIWWAAGWLVLFFTAARSTDVARFYYFFAKHLENERIYAFDPANSALVRSISAVGQHILIFWAGILLAVALLIPFISMGDQSSSPLVFWGSLPTLPTHSAFAWLVVPVSSLFSILLGTAVFLRSEGAMRKTVSKVLHAALHSVESEIVDLVARSGELNEAEWKRVSELRSLHKDLTASGSYRTVLASGLSLLVPLIGPMAAVLKVMSGR